LLHGSLFFLPLPSSFIVVAPCNMTSRNDCCVVDVQIMALQSILLLALCAFAIINAVHPH
jgi:hypothetical protein